MLGLGLKELIAQIYARLDASDLTIAEGGGFEKAVTLNMYDQLAVV